MPVYLLERMPASELQEWAVHLSLSANEQKQEAQRQAMRRRRRRG